MLDVTAEELTNSYRSMDFRMKDLTDAGWDLRICKNPDTPTFRWFASNKDGRTISSKRPENGRRDCVKAAWRKLIQEAGNA